MTEQQINLYAELFQRLSLTELKIVENDSSLFLKRDGGYVSLGDKVGNSVEQNNASPLDAIKAPLLGIFHRAPAPNEPPFVEVGDSVKKGDTLCVIEAMKMMNEITSSKDGVVTEIYAQENSIVEYGQPIFEIN